MQFLSFINRFTPSSLRPGEDPAPDPGESAPSAPFAGILSGLQALFPTGSGAVSAPSVQQGKAGGDASSPSGQGMLPAQALAHQQTHPEPAAAQPAASVPSLAPPAAEAGGAAPAAAADAAQLSPAAEPAPEADAAPRQHRHANAAEPAAPLPGTPVQTEEAQVSGRTTGKGRTTAAPVPASPAAVSSGAAPEETTAVQQEASSDGHAALQKAAPAARPGSAEGPAQRSGPAGPHTNPAEPGLLEAQQRMRKATMPDEQPRKMPGTARLVGREHAAGHAAGEAAPASNGSRTEAHPLPHTAGASGPQDAEASPRDPAGDAAPPRPETLTGASLDPASADEPAAFPEAAPPDLQAAAEPAEADAAGRFESSSERHTAGSATRGEAAPAAGRPLTTAAWLRTILGRNAQQLGAAGDWKMMAINLNEEQGTVTIKARREEDKVSVRFGFSDPAVRALAQAGADRLQVMLQTAYEAAVDLSFSDGAGSFDPEGAARTGDAAAGGTEPPEAADRDGPQPRMLRPGAQHEWIG